MKPSSLMDSTDEVAAAMSKELGELTAESMHFLEELKEVKKATTFGESLTRITTFIQAEVENDGFLEPDEFLKPDQDGVEPNRFHATRMVSNRGNGCNGCRCSII